MSSLAAASLATDTPKSAQNLAVSGGFAQMSVCGGAGCGVFAHPHPALLHIACASLTSWSKAGRKGEGCEGRRQARLPPHSRRHTVNAHKRHLVCACAHLSVCAAAAVLTWGAAGRSSAGRHAVNAHKRCLWCACAQFSVWRDALPPLLPQPWATRCKVVGRGRVQGEVR